VQNEATDNPDFLGIETKKIRAAFNNNNNNLLNRTNYGFGTHSGNQEMQLLNHLLYMDDINL